MSRDVGRIQGGERKALSLHFERLRDEASQWHSDAE